MRVGMVGMVTKALRKVLCVFEVILKLYEPISNFNQHFLIQVPNRKMDSARRFKTSNFGSRVSLDLGV